ncbi:MAG: NAD(P)/FAD-dependent oxidoreductase, partial [Vicinamibacterales bacterium]
GPAGATAALALASAGIAVRLLDRARFPRNKPCGGGISTRVLRRFPYLDGELTRIATHRVSRLYLEGPDGRSAVITAGTPAALMIRRVEFDALLVSLAVAAGAELVTGAEVVQASEVEAGVSLTTRDGKRVTAPIVIAADGVNSVVARRLGLNRGWPASRVALDMMEEASREVLRDVDPQTLWVSYGYQPQAAITRGVDPASDGGSRISAARCPSPAEGYAYIFPKRDHVNIGVGYVLSHFREAVRQPPYDVQRGLVERLRDRGLVVGHSARGNFTPALIPVGGPLRMPGRGRVLLAGDAGGFVNAVTAEGIYYAMVSGELAAHAVRSASSVGELSVRYRRACDYEIGAELRDSVRIQRYLFGDSRRIGQLIDGANREQRIVGLMLDFVAGSRSYRDLRRRILSRSPHLLLSFLCDCLTTKAPGASPGITGI